MKVGVSLFSQNYGDWERYSARDFSRTPDIPDSRVYEQELRLGTLVEPLGFDSLWTVEHHFTPYTMIPNPVQLLTYFAGRTERIDMGTMVIVLPWHDPVRVAEEVAMLDNMLAGRRLTVGLGRGAGRVEFEGLRVEMGESRERFLEALEILRKALTSERFSHDGAFYSIPETSIRPRPRSDDLTKHMYCAWGSPSTLSIAAHAGLGMLSIPQKTWEEYATDVADFNAIRREHGWKPLRPIVVAWVACSESSEDAWEAARTYMGAYWDSARRHYEFDEPEHFRAAKGYEHYAQMSELMRQVDRPRMDELFASGQVWGTPEECFEKLRVIQQTVDAGEFVAVFSYGGMPIEEAEASMRLFAKEVLPEVQRMPVGVPAPTGS